jgi:glucokinase
MTAIELVDDGAIAVSVDHHGRVIARADVSGATDVATAACDALSQLGATAGVVAVATVFDAAAADVAVATLASRGIAVVGRPAASGVAAAVAEAWVGAARDAQNVVYFAIGNRATAGILRDGTPLAGAHRAPAIGWLALNPVERDDYRRSGCLETEVSTAGIVKRLVWRLKAGDRSRAQDAAGGDLAAITLEHILAAAREGDGVSISVVRDAARYLGMAVANMAAIVDPQVVVLGGVIASAADLLVEPICAEVSRCLPPDRARALTIVPAALGVDAPAIGAVRLQSAAAQ